MVNTLIASIDHSDVKDFAGKSEKQRKHYRISIIKMFLSWANKQSPSMWSKKSEDEKTVEFLPDERNIITR